MKGKTIVVGVTGGAAIDKVPGIIRKLRYKGANVFVIMTKNAGEFVKPLFFETPSQNPVVMDMFADKKTWEVEHISLAQRADLLLVVPASANIIGKVANGIADDMLSTVIMATKAPVVFAPAMNNQMYENPIVQANIERLAGYGYEFVGPGTGMLACGYEGKGVLDKPDNIIAYVVNKLEGEK